MNKFLHLFRREEDDAYEAEEKIQAMARAILDWAAQDYHKSFMEWLEAESSKPIPVSKDHMDMVKQAVRANTLREVLKHIQTEIKKAEAARARLRQETNSE